MNVIASCTSSACPRSDGNESVQARSGCRYQMDGSKNDGDSKNSLLRPVT